MSSHLTDTVQELIRTRMATGHYASEEELIVAALEALTERDEDATATDDELVSFELGDEGTPPSAEAIDPPLRQKNEIDDAEKK